MIKRQLVRLGFGVRAHHSATEHSSVMARAAPAQFGGAADHFFRVRCAAQETEVAHASQFGVGEDARGGGGEREAHAW